MNKTQEGYIDDMNKYEKQVMHFMQTAKGYQMMTAEAYDEFEHKEQIINETIEQVEDKVVQTLLKKNWQDVREFIKEKIK